MPEATPLEISDKLLKNRNIDMAKVIEDYIGQDKIYFVVIGTAHFVGSDSIIEILKKKNLYNIKRF
jgi:uncharacterized protein YbaP (TraB family)